MPTPAHAFTLYRMPVSGHCHRVELMLSLLGLPCELVNLDLRKGEHRTPSFLALNPLGQVPVLVDGDTVLSDSNGILVYLVQRYAPGSAWMRVASASTEKPPKTTLCSAPIRAQASMATAASGIIGR